MSAILVKMPPAMRSAAAPSDSPMAKPRKQTPAYSPGMNSRMASMNSSSTEISIMPTLMPERSGMSHTGKALPAQAGEGGARVGQRVDADAVPGHAVAAADADQAEDQHDGDREASRPISQK